MYNHRLPRFCAAALLLALGATAWGQQQIMHAGEYATADVQYGATVYAAQCAQCHGPNGDLISGVNLKSGHFNRASSDDDLRRIITNGIPGTAMPGRQLDNPQITGLVAYLRNMRDFNTESVALGDPARGRALFEGKGNCLSCHTVNGRGSHIGPDLSDIGSQRPASAIEESLIDPTRNMIPINRPVRIVTKTGETVNGRRLNEDTYTVQIIDDHERLRSFDKQNLKEYTVLAQSPMPSYKDRFSRGEMADIVAYLVSLKGK